MFVFVVGFFIKLGAVMMATRKFMRLENSLREEFLTVRYHSNWFSIHCIHVQG